MVNSLYGLGREAFLTGDIAWDTDDIKLILVDSADYPAKDINADQFRDPAIPNAAEVAVSGNFTTKTTTLGTADADDVTLSAVTGDESEEIVIFQDTGVETTSRLIADIDSATGLPVTPNGGDIVVSWDSGANKILTL